MQKMLLKIFIIISISLLTFSTLNVNAHPGNTDADGCHTCRTNCEKWGLEYGEYHCHNSKSSYSSNSYSSSNYSPNNYSSTNQTSVSKNDSSNDNIDSIFILGLVAVAFYTGFKMNGK